MEVLKKTGLKELKSAMVVPMGTGMTLLLAIRGIIDHNANLQKKSQILFPRMDHKSPIKAMGLSGLNITTIESLYGKKLLDNYSSLKKNKLIAKNIEFISTHGQDAAFVPIHQLKEQINENTFGIRH